MKFSVIIPTCQRNDLLALCLDRLAPGAQSVPADRYEVIVTDDGSGSTAERMIGEKYAWAKWVQGPRQGPAANRNNGARRAAGEWLVFTDDDCLPSSDWLKAYEQALAAQPAARVFEGQTLADRERRAMNELSPINDVGGCLWSCNFAVERSVFEGLGGFDVRFPYNAMEDMDMNRRLRQAGHRPVFWREALVIHPWRQTDLRKHTRKHAASQLIYMEIHPDARGQIALGGYLKSVARYFVKDFGRDLRNCGWRYFPAIPTLLWCFFFRIYVFLRRPSPAVLVR